MKIVLTGGGTGGHAYPAICIADALRAGYADCSLLYIGSSDGPEARLAESANIPFIGLDSRRLGRAISIQNVRALLALARNLGSARSALKDFDADLVIGTGGYAAAAVVLAQVAQRGRTLIHEQNVVPGRTNRFIGRFADKICVTFEDTLRFFPAAKTILTGLPVRAELKHLPNKAGARRAFNLEEGLFTVLVLGGSQGARQLNRVVGEAAGIAGSEPFQILHQVGERNFEEASAVQSAADSGRYRVLAYIEDMRSAYAAADLVISRSGASTVAEITAIGIPAIFVPYPFAFADHQRLNAEYVARRGGAVVLAEAQLTASALLQQVRGFMESPESLSSMGAASRSLGMPCAADEVARIAAGMI
ncbi:MAG: undecaprenyldiphospho-muramoylpentapeptide beta-N-acetylglucosaminyltransferase [Bacteroidales bacterium]|nr:undecaprenyldiphospho-muramoylpentapeptide beta-N-acetylglucosaminyltransferase [Bacteroidales bacterium]